MRGRRWLVCIVFALVVVTAMMTRSMRAATTDIYLDCDNGSDSNDGNSSGTAVKTIGKALDIIGSNGTCNLHVINTIVVDGSNTDAGLSLDANGEYKFDSRIKNITRETGFNGNLIEVKDGTLLLENIIFDGGSGNGVKGESLIKVDSGATLNINDGVTLTNNETDGNGGAIYSDGTVNMNGGTISGCKATNGGAIYCKSGTVTITKGGLTQNSVTSDGGGIYVDEAGTLNMSNVAITENKASKGGGIAGIKSDYGIFKASYLDAGIIKGNTGNGQSDDLYMQDGYEYEISPLTGNVPYRWGKVGGGEAPLVDLASFNDSTKPRALYAQFSSTASTTVNALLLNQNVNIKSNNADGYGGGIAAKGAVSIGVFDSVVQLDYLKAYSAAIAQVSGSFADGDYAGRPNKVWLYRNNEAVGYFEVNSGNIQGGRIYYLAADELEDKVYTLKLEDAQLGNVYTDFSKISILNSSSQDTAGQVVFEFSQIYMRTRNVTVKKVVTGTEADKNKKFDFELTVSIINGGDTVGIDDGVSVECANISMTGTRNLKKQFQLGNGESKTFKISYGANVNISEPDSDGYVVYVDDGGGYVEAGNYQIAKVSDQDYVIKFKNNKGDETPEDPEPPTKTPRTSQDTTEPDDGEEPTTTSSTKQPTTPQPTTPQDTISPSQVYPTLPQPSTAPVWNENQPELSTQPSGPSGSQTDSPQTGDKSNLILSGCLFILGSAGFMLMYVLFVRYEEKHEKHHHH